MQNLLTKQKPEGACNTDFHELQKKLSLKLPYDWGKEENHIFQINTFCELSVYTKSNVCEDLEFIMQAFSSH